MVVWVLVEVEGLRVVEEKYGGFIYRRVAHS